MKTTISVFRHHTREPLRGKASHSTTICSVMHVGTSPALTASVEGRGAPLNTPFNTPFNTPLNTPHKLTSILASRNCGVRAKDSRIVRPLPVLYPGFHLDQRQNGFEYLAGRARKHF